MRSVLDYGEAFAQSERVEGQEAFRLLTSQSARLIPEGMGLEVPVLGERVEIRPYAVNISGPSEIGRYTARVIGHAAAHTQISKITDIPGIESYNGLRPARWAHSPIVRLRHSREDSVTGRRTPEPHQRLFEVLDRRNGGTQATRFGLGVLYPGHEGEEAALYICLRQIGQAGLETVVLLAPNPVFYESPDINLGMRRLPFYAFHPDVAASFAEG